jgi:hypothetical protein
MAFEDIIPPIRMISFTSHRSTGPYNNNDNVLKHFTVQVRGGGDLRITVAEGATSAALVLF